MTAVSIFTGENVDLAQIAHDIRWALLVVDAAIPLAGPGNTVQSDLGFAVEATAPDRATAPLAAQHADRSALRAIAFRRVLRELMAYDYEISDEDAAALTEGQRPPKPAETAATGSRGYGVRTRWAQPPEEEI